MPAWVAEWVASRAEKAKKKQEKADAASQAGGCRSAGQRAETRLSRVADGLAALKIWTEDWVKGGIATAPTKGYAFFDEQARRLIDAQAPGLASRVQNLGQIVGSGRGWQALFMTELASVYLLIRAFEKIQTLPPTTREDVLAALGVPAKSDSLSGLAGIADAWQVIAQEVDVEERLRVQRTWLFGRRTRRPALVLAFAHGNMPLDGSLSAATCFDGEVTFFPGNGLRAVVKRGSDVKPLGVVEGMSTLDQFCDLAAGHFAAEPWLAEVVSP